MPAQAAIPAGEGETTFARYGSLVSGAVSTSERGAVMLGVVGNGGGGTTTMGNGGPLPQDVHGAGGPGGAHHAHPGGRGSGGGGAHHAHPRGGTAGSVVGGGTSSVVETLGKISPLGRFRPAKSNSVATPETSSGGSSSAGAQVALFYPGESGETSGGDGGTVAEGTVSVGNVLEGTVSGGNVLEGNVLEGTVSEGTVSEGNVLEGNVSGGNVLEGNVPEVAFAVGRIRPVGRVGTSGGENGPGPGGEVVPPPPEKGDDKIPPKNLFEEIGSWFGGGKV